MAPAFDPSAAASQEPSLSGFRTLRHLGSGGFSSVWELESIETEQRLALKLGHVSTSLLRARFQREADAMHKIGSPSVPDVIATGRLDDGRPWILMERLEGLSLARTLEHLDEPWPVRRVLDVADRILSALELAHAVGYVHRDLKPENIFMCSSPFAVRLLDFGAGEQLDIPSTPETLRLTREGTALGTAEYMAPEQLQAGKHIGIATDIYAIGIILFEMLTLRLPFDACGAETAHYHLTMRPHRPSAFTAIPEVLDELVLQCLEKDPSHRPRTADAVRVQVREAARIARVSSNNIKLDQQSIKYIPAAPLLVSARQPAIVVVTDSRRSPAYLSAAIRLHKGIVARHRPGQFVAAFVASDTRDPIAAALAAAISLEKKFGARVALHLAHVRVRQSPSRPTAVYGQALEHPETWLPPPDAWNGIVFTADLAAAVPELEPLPHPTIPGFFAAREPDAAAPQPLPEADPPNEAPLVGRFDCIDRIHQRIQIAISQQAPSLILALGDSGLGKSRIAAETERLALHQYNISHRIVLRCEASHLFPSPKRISTDLGRALWDLDRNFIVLPKELVETITAPAAEAASQTRALSSAVLRLAANAPLLIILDDAHLADPIALDAIELATLGDQKASLTVLLAAEPRLLEMRPRIGLRADHFDRIDLLPLPEDQAVALCAEFLRPAEYAPRAALARLAAWSAGNPRDLRALCEALKRAGIVKSRPGAGTYYLATDILDQIEPGPATQWLALRRLDALAPELVPVLRCCAVLGNTFSGDKLRAVQRFLERSGHECAAVDTGAALNSFVLRGILRTSPGDEFSFQEPSFQSALASLSDPAERKAIHAAGFAYYLESAGMSAGGDISIEMKINSIKLTGSGALAAWVIHAQALGLAAEAGQGAATLGESALEEGNPALADRFFSLSLDAVDEADTATQIRARKGRASARYRLLRVFEALTDLKTALADAETLGDPAQIAHILLEMATALDWANRYQESAQAAQRAAFLAADIPHLQARISMAQGRTYLRNNQVSDAIDALDRAEQLAQAQDDMETLIVSSLMLSSALVLNARLAEAETHFALVIDRCRAQHDFLHLGSAYANRALLWTARGAIQKALDDLGHAIELAREAGNPWLEHNATHNVSELLYWNDQLEAALQLSRRARILGQRFTDHPVPDDSMLLARTLAALGRLDEARVHFNWIEEQFDQNELGPVLGVHFRALALVLRGAAATDDTWGEIEQIAQAELPAEETLELLTFRAWSALRDNKLALAQELSSRIDAQLETCPIFRERAQRLAHRIDELTGESSTASTSRQLPQG